MSKKTSMSYWFPKIWNAGVPVPPTSFLDMPEKAQQYVWNVFDSNPQSSSQEIAYESFLQKLGIMGSSFGFPCFLRTAFTSAKHGWRDTCFIPDREALSSHVFAIVEFSEMADIRGLPWDKWVVRKLLPTEAAFTAFHGRMPIVPEFRVFAKDGELICCHPYWPEGALKGHIQDNNENWRDALKEHHNIPPEPAIELALKASKAVPSDAWSIDVLLTENGWYVTDMALAHESFHWAGCGVAVPMPEVRTRIMNS